MRRSRKPFIGTGVEIRGNGPMWSSALTAYNTVGVIIKAIYLIAKPSRRGRTSGRPVPPIRFCFLLNETISNLAVGADDLIGPSFGSNLTSNHRTVPRKRFSPHKCAANDLICGAAANLFSGRAWKFRGTGRHGVRPLREALRVDQGADIN